MNTFIKFSRFYPTVSAMVIPAIVMTLMCIEIGIVPSNSWEFVIKLLTFAPIASIFIILGFWLTEIARFVSLIIMEHTKFRQDGVKLPTTTLLSGETGNLSPLMLKKIKDKIKTDFNIEMPESINEDYKLLLNNIVGLIRERNRDNLVLKQYNQEFGFCRNYIGAGVIALIILIVLLIFAIATDLCVWWSVGGGFLQLLLILLFWNAMCLASRQYANYLFYVYVSKL